MDAVGSYEESNRVSTVQQQMYCNSYSSAEYTYSTVLYNISMSSRHYGSGPFIFHADTPPSPPFPTCHAFSSHCQAYQVRLDSTFLTPANITSRTGGDASGATFGMGKSVVLDICWWLSEHSDRGKAGTGRNVLAACAWKACRCREGESEFAVKQGVERIWGSSGEPPDVELGSEGFRYGQICGA